MRVENLTAPICFCFDLVPFFKFFFFFLLIKFLQSIAIAYKRQNPSSIVSVQGYDPRPSIMIKASDNPDLSFRRYGFVEAIKELDPVGSLGLLAPDFKVRSPMLVSVGVQFWFFLLITNVQTFLFSFLFFLEWFFSFCTGCFRSPTASLGTSSLASSRKPSSCCPTMLRPSMTMEMGSRPRAVARSIPATMTRCRPSP